MNNTNTRIWRAVTTEKRISTTELKEIFSYLLNHLNTRAEKISFIEENISFYSECKNKDQTDIDLIRFFKRKEKQLTTNYKKRLERRLATIQKHLEAMNGEATDLHLDYLCNPWKCTGNKISSLEKKCSKLEAEKEEIEQELLLETFKEIIPPSKKNKNTKI